MPTPPEAITGIGTAAATAAGQLEVVAVLGPVAVHARQHDLAGAALGGLGGPADRVAALDPPPAAGHVDVPGRSRAGDRAGVDGDDDALRAEDLGELADQLRPGERRGVDADLVGAGVEDRLGVGDRPDAAADRERDEDLVGGPPGELDDRVAVLVRGGDVEEDELVGALGVVAGGELDRVAGVADVDEVGALDDAAVGRRRGRGSGASAARRGAYGQPRAGALSACGRAAPSSTRRSSRTRRARAW